MAKRADGEGNVRQRADGRWESRLSYIDPVTGLRRSASFYGATAEAVRIKLEKARDRVKVEAPVQDSNTRLAEWIDHWADTALEASSRKLSTKSLYKTLARKHLCPAPLGITPLGRLRKSHIDGLLVRLRSQGLSDSTVRQVYTVLRTVLHDAKLDGLIAENPAVRVARPRVTRTEARHLSAMEVTAVLAAAEGLRYRPVLMLVAATGLRRGEALALRWEHVNLNEGALTVAATLARVGEKLVITEPKTTRSRRTVPLSLGIVSMLKANKAAQAAERLRAGKLWIDSGLVFTTEFGGPVEPRNVLRTMETAAVKAGVENVGVHTLRHSAAAAWLDAGVHIKAVADLLGHSSISVTGDIYGHASDATTRAAIDGLSGALGL
ncbi:tyrosine-type recombinase/integrase [Mycobacterium colombiense]|uniref:tyrosine-type recombinase/integrase n=1 Tax=Mycobacterium colombiense TaxID=339268 RepID=UPI00096E2039|nr:site-specific integrase [Mycobacterium colombiense]OMB93578.1 integrase [Mycobacterium colombiense]